MTKFVHYEDNCDWIHKEAFDDIVDSELFIRFVNVKLGNIAITIFGMMYCPLCFDYNYYPNLPAAKKEQYQDIDHYPIKGGIH